jgi:hypothetical protein
MLVVLSSVTLLPGRVEQGSYYPDVDPGLLLGAWRSGHLIALVAVVATIAALRPNTTLVRRTAATIVIISGLAVFCAALITPYPSEMPAPFESFLPCGAAVVVAGLWALYDTRSRGAATKPSDVPSQAIGTGAPAAEQDNQPAGAHGKYQPTEVSAPYSWRGLAFVAYFFGIGLLLSLELVSRLGQEYWSDSGPGITFLQLVGVAGLLFWVLGVPLLIRAGLKSRDARRTPAPDRGPAQPLRVAPSPATAPRRLPVHWGTVLVILASLSLLSARVDWCNSRGYCADVDPGLVLGAWRSGHLIALVVAFATIAALRPVRPLVRRAAAVIVIILGLAVICAAQITPSPYWMPAPFQSFLPCGAAVVVAGLWALYDARSRGPATVQGNATSQAIGTGAPPAAETNQPAE